MAKHVSRNVMLQKVAQAQLRPVTLGDVLVDGAGLSDVEKAEVLFARAGFEEYDVASAVQPQFVDQFARVFVHDHCPHPDAECGCVSVFANIKKDGSMFFQQVACASNSAAAREKIDGRSRNMETLLGLAELCYEQVAINISNTYVTARPGRSATCGKDGYICPKCMPGLAQRMNPDLYAELPEEMQLASD